MKKKQDDDKISVELKATIQQREKLASLFFKEDYELTKGKFDQLIENKKSVLANESTKYSLHILFHLHLLIHLRTHLHTFPSTFTYTLTYILSYISIYIYIHLHTYTYTYIYIYAYIYIYIYKLTYTFTYIDTILQIHIGLTKLLQNLERHKAKKVGFSVHRITRKKKKNPIFSTNPCFLKNY